MLIYWDIQAQQVFNTMKTAQLQASRARSLKDEIFQTIRHAQLKSVSNLLRNTRIRDRFYLPSASHYSYNRPSADSLDMQHESSSRQCSFSPPSYQHPRSRVYRSSEGLSQKPDLVLFHRHPQKPSVSRSASKIKNQKGGSRGVGVRVGKGRKRAGSEKRGSQYRSGQHKSRDRGISKLNLSSIVEQESSESKLMTPSEKSGRSRCRQGRKMSGDRTKKKDRRGVREVVWRRLERCLREPEKYQRLLKNDILTIRFRVLRKRLLEINVVAGKELQGLTITLHKGNLQCQGINQVFRRVEANSSFSLYSSVRGIDLVESLRLPQLQVEASIHEDGRYERIVTLPFCWLHMLEEAVGRPQRSRIRTKACLDQMGCSRAGLRELGGVLPGWGGKGLGRGYWLWESRVSLLGQDFELRVVEREDSCMGEISGQGEDRLVAMLGFLQELLS